VIIEKGLGLLSGHEATVTITKGSQRGHHWTVQGKSWGTLFRESHPQLRASRSTVLTWQDQRIFTPEHLCASLLAFPHCNLAMDLDVGEIPLLDGSAWPWYLHLQDLCRVPPALSFYSCSIQGRIDFGYGFLEYEPCEDGCLIEASMSSFSTLGVVRIHIKEFADLEPIFKARTFIFQDDWEKAQAAGLLQGAKEGQGLLLSRMDNAFEVLSGGALRHSSEPILHKILDLVGDLSLLGAQLPRLSIRIHNGGHAVHHQLLERILADGHY